MERKNYLVEELTKEEKAYFEKVVISAKNKYLKKNYDYLTLKKVELTEDIIDQSDTVLDIVIRKFEEDIDSAIEFEKEFSDPKLYKFIKALSDDEKMMLFSMFKKGKSIRRYAKEKGVDKNTIKRQKSRLLDIIKKIIGDDENV